ncbi:MAG: OmpA family protein [Psittacicella sp.]
MKKILSISVAILGAILVAACSQNYGNGGVTYKYVTDSQRPADITNTASVTPKASPSISLNSKETLNFPGKSFVVPASDYSKLNNIASYLKGNNYNVNIVGNSSNYSSASYNLLLGSKRAYNVAQYLIGKGISKNRIHIISYGSQKPIVNNYFGYSNINNNVQISFQ